MSRPGYEPGMDDTSQALSALGWSPRFEALYAQHDGQATEPARVIRADRGSMLVASATDTVRAELATSLIKSAPTGGQMPATGDWVVLRRPPGHDAGIIDAVLERFSAFTRGDPGKETAGQVIAANIDTVFVVHPIEGSANLRRIERELALAWESGAVPVVVLTKADLNDDPEGESARVEAVSPGVDVLVVSAPEGTGIEQVAAYATTGRTIALIGPSGAGKSTLINALLGEERQATREVRESDGKGRHTTVTRELIPLEGGGVLVDTPGLRAVAVYELGDGLESAFSDIAAFAEQCRFRDCTHSGEPGCGVQAAVEAGELDASRLASYHRLVREAHVAAMKTDARLRAEETRKWKIIHKSVKGHDKRKNRG